MALIKCRECEKDFSDKANACPKCGCLTSFSISSYNSAINDTAQKFNLYLDNKLLLKNIIDKYSTKDKPKMIKELRCAKSLTLEEATAVIDAYIENGQNLLNNDTELKKYIENKNKKRANKSIKSFLIFIVILFLIAHFFGKDKSKDTEQITETSGTQEDISQQYVFYTNEKIEDALVTAEPAEIILTEEEYKLKCSELYYDEVFFGDTDLEGTYVKLDLMLSEKYFFTVDDLYKNSFQELSEGRQINRDFYKCCVLRKDEDSYVGRQIELWFNDDYGLDIDSLEVGQKIIIYGEVISWSNNTWDGYNSVRVIPKYLEIKE